MSERHTGYGDCDGYYRSRARKALSLLLLRECLSFLRDEHPCSESGPRDFRPLFYSYYLYYCKFSLSMLQLPVGLLQEHTHLFIGRLGEVLVPPTDTIKWLRCHGTDDLIYFSLERCTSFRCSSRHRDNNLSRIQRA